MMNEFEEQIGTFRANYDRVVGQVGRVIVGQDEVIDQVLACLFCGGHGLLEGVPGIGKTLIVHTLARALDLEFGRVQFTPDLMPADITGTNILATDENGAKAFRFQRGPVFANLILADEINRATPKTQSAVLEAMQEGTVSVARTSYTLPQPFVVLATQNPIEMEGTYPLPEAQLDRFMLKITVSSPTVAELSAIMDRTTGQADPGESVEKVADAARVEQIKSLVRRVPAAAHVTRYIARLVAATHPDNGDSPQMVRQYVQYGSSPRGGQAVMLAAKLAAIRDGRANVAFDDVTQAVPAALRHRLILNFEAQADGITTDRIIRQVLQNTPITE